MQEHKQTASSQVIANYELLSALTGQMREAAVRAEWDKLISIEHQCSQLLAATKLVDNELKIDGATHQRKVQLINKILADDAEIRNLIQAWMGQLQLKMQSNFQELRLMQTYGV